jgi:flavoprotein
MVGHPCCCVSKRHVTLAQNGVKAAGGKGSVKITVTFSDIAFGDVSELRKRLCIASCHTITTC